MIVNLHLLDLKDSLGEYPVPGTTVDCCDGGYAMFHTSFSCLRTFSQALIRVIGIINWNTRYWSLIGVRSTGALGTHWMELSLNWLHLWIVTLLSKSTHCDTHNSVVVVGDIWQSALIQLIDCIIIWVGVNGSYSEYVNAMCVNGKQWVWSSLFTVQITISMPRSVCEAELILKYDSWPGLMHCLGQ